MTTTKHRVDKPSWQTHACFNNNCMDWAAGAPHRCEIGRCNEFERALAQWESQEHVPHITLTTSGHASSSSTGA